MGILGASTALAGVTSTTGCFPQPREQIMPFAKRPEDLVPGESLFYSSAFQVGGSVQGILVETTDGRPIKIEGNEKHPGSRGATDAYAQASVLDLYDPARSREPMSLIMAAYAAATDETQARNAASNTLCKAASDRALESSRSADRAKAVFDDCKARIAKDGKWKVAQEGNKFSTTVFLENEEQAPVDWGMAWSVLTESFSGKLAAEGEGLGLVRRRFALADLPRSAQDLLEALPQGSGLLRRSDLPGEHGRGRRAPWGQRCSHGLLARAFPGRVGAGLRLPGSRARPCSTQSGLRSRPSKPEEHEPPLLGRTPPLGDGGRSGS